MPPNQLKYYFDEYTRVLDYYTPIFDLMNKQFSPKRVLYPGSYCHITPSLFYPYVVYVDHMKKIRGFFTDQEVLTYIADHKSYAENAAVKFYFQDYHMAVEESLRSFDLLISLNAGLISQACKRYVRSHGILLVNDEHYDARTAYIDEEYRLIAVYNDTAQTFDQSNDDLSKYFHTSKGIEMTPQMVRKSITKPPSKDPFKPRHKSSFYLFNKI